MEFFMTLAAAMLVFVAMLVIVGGIKNTVATSTTRIGALYIGQSVASAAHAMWRDACEVSCSSIVVLPRKLLAFGQDIDYNISLKGSKVAVATDKETTLVEAGLALEGLQMEQRNAPEGKIVTLKWQKG